MAFTHFNQQFRILLSKYEYITVTYPLIITANIMYNVNKIKIINVETCTIDATHNLKPLTSIKDIIKRRNVTAILKKHVWCAILAQYVKYYSPIRPYFVGVTKHRASQLNLDQLANLPALIIVGPFRQVINFFDTDI